MDGAKHSGCIVQVQLLDDSRGLPFPLLGHRVYTIQLIGGNTPTEGVIRRYSDFRHLHESLLQRRPHRLIPELPNRGLPELLPALPGFSTLAIRQRRQRRQFLEQRETGLRDYLTALIRHPVLSRDAELEHFLEYRGDDYTNATKQAGIAIGGWEHEPGLSESTNNRSGIDEANIGHCTIIESWLIQQRNLMNDRLKTLIEICNCLEQHREASWAAVGALRGFGENFSVVEDTIGSSPTADTAATVKQKNLSEQMQSVANEISDRCYGEWLATQSADWLQMLLIGYLRLHDRLTSSVASLSGGDGSKRSALLFVRDRLLLEGRPADLFCGQVLRQLLLEVAEVQLKGNRFLEAEWRSIEKSVKEV